MKKVILLFVVFLVLSFHVIILVPRDLKVFDGINNHEIKTQLEESNEFPTLYAIINSNHILFSDSEVVIKYYSPYYKFKQLQILLTHTSTLYSLILAIGLILGFSFSRIIFVPIYLQSENLRL